MPSPFKKTTCLHLFHVEICAAVRRQYGGFNMKKLLSKVIAAGMVLSIAAAQTVSVSASTVYKDTYRNADTDRKWIRTVNDAEKNTENWTFVTGNTERPGWAAYTDFNEALSAENSSKGVYANITSLPNNPRGRTGFYHKSIQADAGGRVLQFTGGGFKNFAVTFDLQAINTWNEAANRKSTFDFGFIDNSLPVQDLLGGYSGLNYVHMDDFVNMQTLTIPSGIAGGEISPRAAVINTKTAADYPGATVVTKTDSVTGKDYIESVTENGVTTYWNQVINCKVVLIGDVISIYMKFEDTVNWKKIGSYGIPNAGFSEINKRFYMVCSGFQSLVSNVDIWQKSVEISSAKAIFTRTDSGYTVSLPIGNNTGAPLTAVLAAYGSGENGTLDGVDIYNAAAGENIAEFTVSSISDNPSFKLFIWDDLLNMVPITDALKLTAK